MPDPSAPYRSDEEIIGHAFAAISRILGRTSQELLAKAPPPEPKRRSPIQQAAHLAKKRVCAHLDIPIGELETPSRKAVAVEARWICWYLLRASTRLSSPALGGILGGPTYDHSSVLNGLKRLDQRMVAAPQRYLWVAPIHREVEALLDRYAASS